MGVCLPRSCHFAMNIKFALGNEIQNGGHSVRDLLNVIQGHETSASSKLSVAIFVDEDTRERKIISIAYLPVLNKSIASNKTHLQE